MNPGIYLYLLLAIVIGVIAASTVWGQFPSKIKQKKKATRYARVVVRERTLRLKEVGC